jgi:hypothetical protein
MPSILISFAISGYTESGGQKNTRRRIRRLFPLAGIGTALVGEKPDERVHRRIVRPTNQGRRLPLLCHQPCLDQALQVMRERRRGDPEPILKAADGEALGASAHKDAVDAEARRVAERLQLTSCCFDFHGTTLVPFPVGCQFIFRHLWNQQRSGCPAST